MFYLTKFIQTKSNSVWLLHWTTRLHIALPLQIYHNVGTATTFISILLIFEILNSWTNDTLKQVGGKTVRSKHIFKKYINLKIYLFIFLLVVLNFIVQYFIYNLYRRKFRKRRASLGGFCILSDTRHLFLTTEQKNLYFYNFIFNVSVFL